MLEAAGEAEQRLQAAQEAAEAELADAISAGARVAQHVRVEAASAAREFKAEAVLAARRSDNAAAASAAANEAKVELARVAPAAPPSTAVSHALLLASRSKTFCRRPRLSSLALACACEQENFTSGTERCVRCGI